MKKVDNEDQHIIKLLKQMPKMNDTSNKDELYKQISSRLDHEKTLKRKNRTALLPIVSTIFVIAILLVIAPLVIKQDFLQTENKQYANDAVKESVERSAIKEEQSQVMLDQGEAKQEANILMADYLSVSRVVMDVNSENSLIYTAVAGKQGQFVIPLTFVVPNSDDITGEYEKLATYIKEDEWGVGGYLFKDAKLSIDQANHHVVMTLPNNFSFGEGSTNANMFNMVIAAMFRPLGINKVIFKSADGDEVDLGPFGKIHEMTIEPAAHFSYKLYQESDSAQSFFVPVDLNEKIDISGALEEMEEENEGFPVKRTIPKHIDYSISAKEPLTVTFADDAHVGNNQTAVTMIEAILLTAKSYGYESVLFKNTMVDQIGMYDVSKPISVPIAVNPVQIQQ